MSAMEKCPNCGCTYPVVQNGSCGACDISPIAKAGRTLLAEAATCGLCDGKGEVLRDGETLPCPAEDCRARRTKYGS